MALPMDLRDYFLCVNGMPSGVCDEVLIRFWMLEEVKPLSEGAPDFSSPRYINSPESVFLLADYSIWAHAYAIRLSRNTELNEIFVVGGNSPILIFKSFSEFVDSYITDKYLLFP